MEERNGLPTFVMDYCFPSQGDERSLIVLVLKEIRTKAIGAFMVPNKGCDEWLVKTIVQFMASCGCGRSILKSDGEPAIVALQEAIVRSRQSETIVENSPKGDSQSNGAAENAVRETEGMIRTWKVYVEERLGTRLDNRHVLLPWLVLHAGLIHTRYKISHDGKTAYQKIKGKRPSSKVLPFGEKVIWMMPKDNSRRKNILESAHHFGIFVGVVPRTGEFLVLTPEGAIPVRNVPFSQVREKP